MKQYLFAGSILFLCLCLVIAFYTPVDLSENFTINEFAEFLDNEHFVPDIDQGDFVDQIGAYQYQGQPLSSILVGSWVDGLGGGGFYGGGKFFYLKNYFFQRPWENFATYTNQFHTDAPLEGLELPYGIDFEDTLEEVLKKLGVTIDPDCRYFNSKAGNLTLYSAGKEQLQLIKKDDDQYIHTLQYTHTYKITDPQEPALTREVTRFVKLSFLLENQQLGRVELSVSEKIPWNI